MCLSSTTDQANYTTIGMEENIAILVQHNDKWDIEHNYNNLIVDGVIVKVSSNLDTIIHEMTKILGVYASTNTMEIKYSVMQNCTPMKISMIGV